MDFEIEAEQPGHAPAAEAFALVQPPTISAAGVGRVAALLVLVGAAIAAWFGVIRPTIEDTAEQAVDDEVARFQEAIDELGADIDLAARTGDDSEPAQPTTAATEDGDPEFRRLVVSAVRADTQSDSFTVDEGRLFDLTDIRIENTNDDVGRASLAINGEEAYVWSLENIRGALFEPRITPIRLQAGDNVTFTVRCDTVGSPAAGACSAAVNLSGRSTEAG